MTKPSAAVVLCFAMLSAACPQHRFETSVIGDRQGQVTFSFFERQDQSRLGSITLTSVQVIEWAGNDHGTAVIWRVAGRRRLNSLIYGASQTGLKEDIPAAPLRHGRNYSVLVSGRTTEGLAGSSASFTFRDDGSVLNTRPSAE